MVCMQKIFIGSAAVGLAVFGAFCYHKRAQPAFDGVTIGIVQFASHPALDQARDGFTEMLTAALGSKVRFVFHNAQGSMAMAQTMAQQCASDSAVAGVFAIATPAAQVVQATMPHKSLFIAAVSDPQHAGLLGSESLVCGATDKVDGGRVAAFALRLVPGAQRIALVFNPSEQNAAAGAKEMEVVLRQAGKEVMQIGISEGADVATAVSVACSKADLVLCPCDNTVASHIGIIAQLTQQAHKPCIVSDYLLVRHGVLAACGIDYKQSGVAAGMCAVAVLIDGAKPSELPLAGPEQMTIMIHKQLAAELGVVLEPALASQVTFFDQEMA